MKTQTFGVEIEMNNITRRRAAEVAANYFGRPGDYADTHVANGYHAWSAWDTQGREWKFVYDCSIDGPTDEKCELTTPILHYEDMELLQELVRQLRHAGAKSDNTRGCGVHIHVGAEGQTPTSLRHLANMMAAHEQLIINAVQISNYRLTHYCKPVDPNFIAKVNQVKPKTMDALADVWYTSQHATYDRDGHYNESRYHMLNLHATFTKGTIEFRLFQFAKPEGHKSGLHAGRIKAWVQFCLAICDAAKKAKASRPDHVQTDNMKYAMTGWLCRMGLVGEEYDTLRKIFNKHLTGNAAKRYAA